MTIAYFDCFSGAAGDMIVAACLDAGAPADHLRRQLATLDLPEVQIHIEKTLKNGIAATLFSPQIHDHPDQHRHNHSHEEHDHHQHPHDEQVHGPQSTVHSPRTTVHGHPPRRNLPIITDLINHADLSPTVKQNALKIFQRLAQAEAHIHNTTIDHIHFHEVGAADAIIDIVGACVALESLDVQKLYCSPLALGSGTVKCRHGILPVPAPATAELIKNLPTQPSFADGELLTPTGAAILTTLAEGFGPMPPLCIDRIGYGAGQRNYPHLPNVLRLILGRPLADSPSGIGQDQVYLLQTNIDDASAELLGHLTDILLQNGALDVFCTAITMKKNRPATQLSVLCRPDDLTRCEHLLFQESTTFGLRRQLCQRSILPRDQISVDTPYGPIRIKRAFLDGAVTTAAPEFEDCRTAAQKHHVPLKQIINAALTAYHQAHSAQQSQGR